MAVGVQQGDLRAAHGPPDGRVAGEVARYLGDGGASRRFGGAVVVVEGQLGTVAIDRARQAAG